MDIKFGTSGLRGLAEDLVAGTGARYARAFGAWLVEAGHAGPGAAVFLGQDLRESSPALARAVAAGLEAAGLRPVDCGAVPTPALAGFAMERGAASVMVTGSHIPADRNGLKFYRPDGEIDKDDEGAIATLADRYDAISEASARPRAEDNDAVLAWYRRRYRGLLAADALAGWRIGIYEQSSVARDVLPAILSDCSAEIVPLGRSDTFVAVDTEAIDPETVTRLRHWAGQHRIDAIVSTDGDGDRPLVTDETGTPIRGDALGLLSALSLGADCVVTPVTSNSGIDDSRGFRTVRTRVGSPYVIAAMSEAEGCDRIIGFEANGGLMTATPIERNGVRLAALPTRDAVLPILCTLERALAAGKPLSRLVAELALPVALSDRLKDYPQEVSARLLSRLATRAGAEDFVSGLGAVGGTDTIDGVRILFEDGATIHFRASGNAPEMRCYAQAPTSARGEALLAAGLERLESERSGRAESVEQPRFVLVMGVCGVGKTSVGRALAERLGGAFVEGDDFHSAENKARMQAGQPLTDEMRLPWLGAIADAALARADQHTPVVIACSALKRRYRDLLRSRLGDLAVVHLTGERDLIARRMAARKDHFMPVAMLDSQLRDLEAPAADEAVTVDIAAPTGDIVEKVTALISR